MEIIRELLYKELGKILIDHFLAKSIDYEKLAESSAIAALAEIQSVPKEDSLDDFSRIEKIVGIFEQNALDFGSCHDF